MNSSDLLKTIRYFLANDADIQHWLGVANYTDALKRMLYKDSAYTSTTDTSSYSYPGITFKFSDDADDVLLPSNNVTLELGVVNIVKNPNSMHTCLRLKDRIKELMINKSNQDRKQDAINTQGQSLGCNPKVRGVFWVSAPTYDDKEQGAERLHRINCLLKLVVGD